MSQQQHTLNEPAAAHSTVNTRCEAADETAAAAASAIDTRWDSSSTGNTRCEAADETAAADSSSSSSECNRHWTAAVGKRKKQGAVDEDKCNT